MKQLDKTDLSILEYLQRDGRITNTKLASKLSLSETACWRRINRLEDEGYIQDYQANLDRKAIGYGVMVFVQLTYVAHDEATTRAFEDAIYHCDNVLACYNTTGDDDFLLQVVAKDLDDYSQFVEKVLRKLVGVSSVKSNISLRELKSSSRFPILKNR